MHSNLYDGNIFNWQDLCVYSCRFVRIRSGLDSQLGYYQLPQEHDSGTVCRTAYIFAQYSAQKKNTGWPVLSKMFLVNELDRLATTKFL